MDSFNGSNSVIAFDEKARNRNFNKTISITCPFLNSIYVSDIDLFSRSKCCTYSFGYIVIPHDGLGKTADIEYSHQIFLL